MSFRVQQNILRFQVSIYNSVLVQVLQSHDRLCHDLFQLLRTKMVVPLSHVLLQVPARAILCDNVQAVLALEGRVKFYEERILPHQLQSKALVDEPLQSLFIGHSGLLHYFNGHLRTGGLFHGKINGSSSSLAYHFQDLKVLHRYCLELSRAQNALSPAFILVGVRFDREAHLVRVEARNSAILIAILYLAKLQRKREQFFLLSRRLRVKHQGSAP
mmetsp:Transcript_4289/g.18303  ORF Transcript_4289/g.18303 Transcript_4289/m.18303 type:complete len:216 (-) Transcript_4289:412-1059(-)